MKEEIKRLQYKTKANDVDDEKGIVTVAVNGIGVKDSQDDISMPGSFNKTLKENIGRMRWFLNHRTDQLLGVPLEGKEEGGNLIMTGQLNLDKEIGRDILADYKLFAENGRTLEHSIGVRAMKRDEQDKRKVLEWKMFEYSTLTHWGSNPQTFLVGIKSATADQVKEACDFIRKAFQQHGYTDERLKAYDMELNLPEHTFSQQVIDLAAQFQRWITEDIVRQEMEKLTPEIREQVTAVLDIVLSKSGKPEFEQKGLTDIMSYVRCPHCYSRVYKSNAIIQDASTAAPSTATPEPSGDTQKEGEQSSQGDDVKEKAAEGTLPDFKELNHIFN